MSGITVLASWFQPTGIPLPWLIVAASLAFMAVANGIFTSKQLFFQDNPEGKLRVAGVILGKYYKQGKLVGIKYGLEYTNQGWFPIEFKVMPQQVSLGASFNPKPVRKITGGIAQIGATGVFWEAVVPVTREMKGTTVEGNLIVDVRYGRVGKLKHNLHRNYAVHITFRVDGEVMHHESGEIIEQAA